MAVLEAVQPQFQVQWCPSAFNSLPSQKPHPEADTWVKLIRLPSAYCQDEALLLCPKSDTEWFAWVPGHGETVLHVNYFCIQYV